MAIPGGRTSAVLSENTNIHLRSHANLVSVAYPLAQYENHSLDQLSTYISNERLGANSEVEVSTYSIFSWENKPPLPPVLKSDMWIVTTLLSDDTLLRLKFALYPPLTVYQRQLRVNWKQRIFSKWASYTSNWPVAFTSWQQLLHKSDKLCPVPRLICTIWKAWVQG